MPRKNDNAKPKSKSTSKRKLKDTEVKDDPGVSRFNRSRATGRGGRGR
jgi:hypothetical protein